MKQNYYQGYDRDLDRLEHIILHLENDELCDFMIGNEPLFIQLEEHLKEMNIQFKENGFKSKSEMSEKFKELQKRAFLIFIKRG